MLEGAISYEGEEVELRVVYPDSFPFMRPEVFAPGLLLERHQNPVDRNLCLLGALNARLERDGYGGVAGRGARSAPVGAVERRWGEIARR